VVTAVGVAACLAGPVSCAKQAAPPGGPEDKTAPRLVESEPATGSTRVARTASIRLSFSEKLNERSFERGLVVNPRVRWAKFSWSGENLELIPVDSLRADSTYVLTLGSSIQDRRSNVIPIPVAVGFSTGSRVDKSVLVGNVMRAGKPVARAGVWLYEWGDDPEVDPEVDVPYRQTETDAQGGFVLPFLRPATRAYQLFAYLDANRTGAFEEGDPAGFFQEPLTVSAAPETTGGIEIDIWDSGRTGSISGRLFDEWDPEGALWIRVLVPKDSTTAVEREGKISRPGRFLLGGIPPGKVLLEVYQDLNGNEQWDDTEDLSEPRAGMPDTLEVTAGEKIRNVEFRRGPQEER